MTALGTEATPDTEACAPCWPPVRVADLFALLATPIGNANALLPAEPASATTSTAAGEPAIAAPDAPTAGLTLAEFAMWAGIDRRRLAASLIEIAPGPVPPLPPGKVPCRRIGDTRRIFPADFRGDPSSIGERDGRHHQEAPAGTTQAATAWARQVARLRRR